MAKDPFDFTDLSDLPEDLQKVLHRDSNDSAKEYADVVAAGAAAGHDELDINQIIAAATRMGKEVPSQQTVRGYLNKAVRLGMISKPTRQTYGPPTGDGPVTKTPTKAATVVSDDPVVTTEPEADPLAELGL